MPEKAQVKSAHGAGAQTPEEEQSTNKSDTFLRRFRNWFTRRPTTEPKPGPASASNIAPAAAWVTVTNRNVTTTTACATAFAARTAKTIRRG
jgi:hypothetical protein